VRLTPKGAQLVPGGVSEQHVSRPVHLLRWLGRTIRHRMYPIPTLARRYVRMVGSTYGAALPSNAVCLDVGAGASPYRKAIEETLDIGLYVSLEIAASDATTLVGDAACMPLRNDSVDIVICMEILQHVPDTRRVLQEVKRVLAPGGLMILSFPFIYAECELVDFHRWSMQGMEFELRHCGFELIDARRRGGAFFTAASALHWAAQHIIPGGRRSWRFSSTPTQVVRAAIVHLLTVPTALLGWLALGIDAVVPVRGLYVGGLMVARRPRTE
jgi:SAM-dependent methyltransferase